MKNHSETAAISVDSQPEQLLVYQEWSDFFTELNQLLSSQKKYDQRPYTAAEEIILS